MHASPRINDQHVLHFSIFFHLQKIIPNHLPDANVKAKSRTAMIIANMSKSGMKIAEQQQTEHLLQINLSRKESDSSEKMESGVY